MIWSNFTFILDWYLKPKCFTVKWMFLLTDYAVRVLATLNIPIANLYIFFHKSRKRHLFKKFFKRYLVDIICNHQCILSILFILCLYFYCEPSFISTNNKWFYITQYILFQFLDFYRWSLLLYLKDERFCIVAQ